LRRLDVKTDIESLKSDWHILRNSQRPSEVQISFYGDFDALSLDAHRGSHHLARNLRASGQRSEKQIPGAFGFLEKAYSEKSLGICSSLKADLLLDSLRPDPRFQSLLRGMALKN
jgi:hypothetical protein